MGRGGWPLRLTVTSGGVLPAGIGSERPVATILIEDLTPAVPGAEVVRLRHGLTQTEARIAATIARGLEIDETASAHSISRNTVRAHLRSMYEQTGTHIWAEVASVCVMVRLNVR